jgi:hypothetical protein
MAPTIQIPDAPKHLPDPAKKQWRESYVKAFDLAKRDNPDNESAQRGAASKAANAMLSVPAPQSADDIQALEKWQVLHRGVRTIEDIEIAFCVTSDGQKYAFPVTAKKSKEPKTPAA